MTDERTSRSRFGLGVLALVILVVAVLLLMRAGEDTAPSGPRERLGGIESGADRQVEFADPVPRAPVEAPPTRIAENGRISVTLDALRDGDDLAIALSMPDEARGTGPRPVRLVDVAGRATDAEAVPIDGPGTGLRLEFDPAWLEPGRYLISVTTAEKTHLPGRRFVLEVLDAEAAAEPR